jgi:hypothetical protein
MCNAWEPLLARIERAKPTNWQRKQNEFPETNEFS